MKISPWLEEEKPSQCRWRWASMEEISPHLSTLWFQKAQWNRRKLYANATRGRAFSDEETQTDYSKCMLKKEVKGNNQGITQVFDKDVYWKRHGLYLSFWIFDFLEQHEVWHNDLDRFFFSSCLPEYLSHRIWHEIFTLKVTV